MNKDTTPAASASRHTPGLLTRNGNLISGGPDNRECVFKVGTHILESREKANGERIVSIWNACAGMADPAAEIADLRREHARLAEFSGQAAAQIAALREALELCCVTIERLGKRQTSFASFQGTLDVARAALAGKAQS